MRSNPASRLGAAAGLLVAIALVGCGSRSDAPAPPAEASAKAEASGVVLRLGDVDPDTPARRTLRLQPLADYLALRLRHLGVSAGQVVIARNMDEMAKMLVAGDVDLYVDSAYPTLVVQEKSGARTLLRRWAQGAPEYRTLFVSSAAGDIESLEQLQGSVLALQEEYSTSGYLLPAAMLIEKGFALQMVGGPDEQLSPTAIHYHFTRDEENTIELVNTGRVAAGVVSDQEYAGLPAELRGHLRVIAETSTVPRQLLSMRADLDPALVEGLSHVLRDLAPGDEPPVQLESSQHGWTWKFDDLPPESQEGLERLREMARTLGIL